MSQPIQEPTIGLGEDIEAFGYKQELRRGLQLHDVVLYGVLFMVLIAPQSIWGSLQVDSGGLTPLVYIIGFLLPSASHGPGATPRCVQQVPQRGLGVPRRAARHQPACGLSMSGWPILLDYILVPSLLLVMVANWGTTLVPGSPWWLWVVVFIAFNTFVNVRGITMSKGVDWIIFAVEILALIVFIAVGCMYVSGGGGYGEFSTEPFYVKTPARSTSTLWPRPYPWPACRSSVSTACPPWPRKPTSPRRTSARASSSRCAS
ncbi:MAG: hypothetical protein ACLTDR_12575 [Adlercreutzia equolifaciens]